MIIYESAKLHPRQFCQRKGSVMPFSICVALPCACLAVLLKILPQYLEKEGILTAHEAWNLLGIDDESEQIASAAFSGVNFLIGFLVVFRSSQAYNRFWEGLSAINSMQGEWWDAASSLVAFCKMAEADHKTVILFQHTFIRLISLLNGCVLMELSQGFNRDENRDSSQRAFELELVDAEGIDSQSLRSVQATNEKVELVFQWIQQLIVENDALGVFSVQGAVLSRAFQELSNGMVQYRQASKIARTPLPFPYMQATELLLVSHWLCTPVLMCTWVQSPIWVGILSFIQVMFYWSLNSIATELENPFGEDENDLPAKEIQQDFNRRLLLLLRPMTIRTAKLSEQAAFEETKDCNNGKYIFGRSVTLGADGGIHGLTPTNPQLHKRRSSLENNKITWGALQQEIISQTGRYAEYAEEKVAYAEARSYSQGEVPNIPEEEPAALDTDRIPSSSSGGLQRKASNGLQHNILLPRHRDNFERSERNPTLERQESVTERGVSVWARTSSKLEDDARHRRQAFRRQEDERCLELPPLLNLVEFNEVWREFKQLAALVDHKRLPSQFACLESLPELLTAVMDHPADVRDQVRAGFELMAPDDKARDWVVKAEVPCSSQEALQELSTVHRVAGKSLGDDCLGMGGCPSPQTRSHI